MTVFLVATFILGICIGSKSAFGVLCFGTLWLFQLFGFLGDPDGKRKSTSAGNTDASRK